MVAKLYEPHKIHELLPKRTISVPTAICEGGIIPHKKLIKDNSPNLYWAYCSRTYMLNKLNVRAIDILPDPNFHRYVGDLLVKHKVIYESLDFPKSVQLMGYNDVLLRQQLLIYNRTWDEVSTPYVHATLYVIEYSWLSTAVAKDLETYGMETLTSEIYSEPY